MIRARESKSAPVGVVRKVLRILEALDRSPEGLHLREIAQSTGINKSTAYRFLAHLEKEQYLFRDNEGAYIVGPKLARLGAGHPYHETLRKVSRPMIHQLWRATEETVNLGTLDGQDVLYLEVKESTHPFRMASQVGMHRPLTCTALGKVILANLAEEQREELLASMKLPRFTSHSMSNLARLRKELEKIQVLGHAIDDQEIELGARCVAAPIFDASGQITAALSISGPTARVSGAQIRKFASAVKQCASVISARLGYAGKTGERSEPLKAAAARGVA
jgi:DNA-binding IclR family transcriptional regulator